VPKYSRGHSLAADRTHRRTAHSTVSLTVRHSSCAIVRAPLPGSFVQAEAYTQEPARGRPILL